MLAAGRDTVLGDAAAEEQLFLTSDYEDIALADISGGRKTWHGVLMPAVPHVCCIISLSSRGAALPHWKETTNAVALADISGSKIAVKESNVPCANTAQRCAAGHV
jgi:formylmethanofuran dehydrogenase subunit D